MSQYHVDQIDRVLKKDWGPYLPAIKISSHVGETNFMDVTREQLEAIKEILRGAE